MSIRHVFFDFGGVIAEEGFLNGLKAVAAQEGRDPEAFFWDVREIIIATGYITGHAGEAEFWRRVEKDLHPAVSADDLRREILSRFRVRPLMIDLVRRLRAQKVKVAMLSDQTNWLDELDARDGFFREFDKVFNSYRYGHHKGQREFFDIALAQMGADPATSLFVDDAEGNIAVARDVGLKAIHFTGLQAFARDFAAYFPGLLPLAPDGSGREER
ncbi:HAD-superfamily hydrolase, subfamily IA, variant 3 [Desulfovibrio sp. X2]|uniref:HAD family hydrolase n=1 Tax=Desulfovibrio sp. X2 TaxID=941449 RepID=UPI000358C155|nr:HAD family phosphatase [Desulfovibrio sp. X2]EPR42663.1 HAD-superfamily hydrolase, subfamily IA, variant 3 [Desulfovibrio sp. X2]